MIRLFCVIWTVFALLRHPHLVTKAAADERDFGAYPRYTDNHNYGYLLQFDREINIAMYDVRLIFYMVLSEISQGLSQDTRVVTLASPFTCRPAGYLIHEEELSPSSIVPSHVNDIEIEVSGQNRNEESAEYLTDRLIQIPQYLPPPATVDVGIQANFA